MTNHDEAPSDPGVIELIRPKGFGETIVPGRVRVGDLEHIVEIRQVLGHHERLSFYDGRAIESVNFPTAAIIRTALDYSEFWSDEIVTDLTAAQKPTELPGTEYFNFGVAYVGGFPRFDRYARFRDLAEVQAEMLRSVRSKLPIFGDSYLRELITPQMPTEDSLENVKLDLVDLGNFQIGPSWRRIDETYFRRDK